MSIIKRTIQFVLGVVLTIIGIPNTTTIVTSLCIQFVCKYPLTNLPKDTCGYCYSINILFFILGVISLVMFAVGLTKDILNKNRKEQRKV